MARLDLYIYPSRYCHDVGQVYHIPLLGTVMPLFVSLFGQSCIRKAIIRRLQRLFVKVQYKVSPLAWIARCKSRLYRVPVGIILTGYDAKAFAMYVVGGIACPYRQDYYNTD